MTLLVKLVSVLWLFTLLMAKPLIEPEPMSVAVPTYLKVTLKREALSPSGGVTPAGVLPSRFTEATQLAGAVTSLRLPEKPWKS